jgi:hypothetical protein
MLFEKLKNQLIQIKFALSRHKTKTPEVLYKEAIKKILLQRYYF